MQLVQSPSEKGSEPGFMLCCRSLEILNKFWTGSLVFSFCTEPPKLLTSSGSAIKNKRKKTVKLTNRPPVSVVVHGVFYRSVGSHMLEWPLEPILCSVASALTTLESLSGQGWGVGCGGGFLSCVFNAMHGEGLSSGRNAFTFLVFITFYSLDTVSPVKGNLWAHYSSWQEQRASRISPGEASTCWVRASSFWLAWKLWALLITSSACRKCQECRFHKSRQRCAVSNCSRTSHLGKALTVLLGCLLPVILVSPV